MVATQANEATAGPTPLATGEVLPEEAVDVEETPMIAPPAEKVNPWESWESFQKAIRIYWDLVQTSTRMRWQSYQRLFQDLFSERPVTLKQVEVTTIAVEGAVSGLVALGLVFALLDPGAFAPRV